MEENKVRQDYKPELEDDIEFSPIAFVCLLGAAFLLGMIYGAQV